MLLCLLFCTTSTTPLPGTILLALTILLYSTGQMKRFLFYNHFLRSYVHWIFEEVVMMALFSWLIVNIAANPNNVLKISNRLTEYLGKISYGIYLYHCIVITLVVYVFQKLNLTGSPNLGVIVFYALVFLLTFVVSALSYTYFESKFLLLKKKFRQASS